ncbi:cytochrome c-type biogenesis protein CcmH [bacterium]|nr:cytochrome c-type biogenesis protein CcmH [bacterium]
MNNFKIRRLLRYPMVMMLIVGFSGSLFFLKADDMEDRVREISHKLRCPTCQAMSVKESDAGLSLNMKNKIREMLQEGKSEEEILTFFEERYGEWILRSPKKEGFNLFLWLLPGFLIVIASILLFRSLLKRSRDIEQKKLDPLSENEKKLIDQELNHYQSD